MLVLGDFIWCNSAQWVPMESNTPRAGTPQLEAGPLGVPMDDHETMPESIYQDALKLKKLITHLRRMKQREIFEEFFEEEEEVRERFADKVGWEVAHCLP